MRRDHDPALNAGSVTKSEIWFRAFVIEFASYTRSFFFQEYKVSSFEQRLMNEIEYRLEQIPPINEDPEDAMFEDVPVAQQVILRIYSGVVDSMLLTIRPSPI